MESLASLSSNTGRVVKMMYPTQETSQKVAYATSAVLFVSLFVISCLTCYTSVHIPHVGWISLGLGVGSFGALMVGGTWKHSFSLPMQGELKLLGCCDVKKWHLGRGREILHTLPIFIICLVGALGGCSVETMAKGIFATQLLSAGLYYGVIGLGAPIAMKKGLDHVSGAQQEDSTFTKLVKVGYPLNTTTQKGAYGLAAAVAITMFVLTCLSAWGSLHIPSIGWVNAGLGLGSFLLLLAGGLRNHKATWQKDNEWSLGLWRESLQLIAIIALCALGTFNVYSLKDMAIGIVATQILSAGLYAFIANQFKNRMDQQQTSVNSNLDDDLSRAMGGTGHLLPPGMVSSTEDAYDSIRGGGGGGAPPQDNAPIDGDSAPVDVSASDEAVGEDGTLA